VTAGSKVRIPGGGCEVKLASGFTEHVIDDPAAADVDAVGVAAVVENDGVFAPGVLEGVGEDWHRGELARLVHLPGQLHDGGGTPVRVEGDGVEGVAEDVAEAGRGIYGPAIVSRWV
jgi:hypothetical protein